MRHAIVALGCWALVGCSGAGSSLPADGGTSDAQTLLDAASRDGASDAGRDAAPADAPAPDAPAPGDSAPPDGLRIDTAADAPKPAPDAAPTDTVVVFSDKGPADRAVPDARLPDAPACPAPVHDLCSAPETLSWAGSAISRSGTTACAKNQLDVVPSASCNLPDGTPGFDVFYTITLPPGRYTVRLTPAAGWDAALYVLASCASTTSCVATSDLTGVGVVEDVLLTPTSSTTYVLGVDSYHPMEQGPFTLEVLPGPALNPDAGVRPDAGPPPPDAAPRDTSSTAPTLVITEVMVDPSRVSDSEGEWVEIFNAGGSSVLLNGWRIRDNAGGFGHTINAPTLSIAPGQYRVLARNDNATQNGGVSGAYSYGSAMSLSNSGDYVELLTPAGVLMDRVAWTSGWPFRSGQSMSLKSPALDNSLVGNWCREAIAWTGSAGDKGTPGAATKCGP
ncbi:MAG: lamin tail domain-containing protein [Deltaproteobacteria bacterium]|nr:lamin tail domain-containing protein [Deltaproteobacteria bacterium]